MNTRHPMIIPAALAAILLAAAVPAQASDADAAAQLKAQAEEHHAKANDLFASLADYQGTEEDGRRLRTKTREQIDAALVALDILIEQHPDEEKWAEKMLEQVFSISFWLDRFTVIDDFDYYASTTVGQDAKQQKSRNESAEVALEKAASADETGDEAAAFYEYMDVIQHHAKESVDGAAKARERLRALRGTLTTQGILSFLKTELKSDVPDRRAFAAKEMATLRTSYAARPLAQALKKEEDGDVQKALLDAFQTTQKRASGKELGYLAKSKDEALKLDVLDVLQQGVGGRHGAHGALQFARDKSEKVADRAILVMTDIGGIGGAEALGIAAGKARTPDRVQQLFDCLVRVGNNRAAEVLVPYCETKARYQEAAEDAMVRIGEPAIIPCINSMPNRKLGKNLHYVLKRITGKTFGQSQDKWHSWWISWHEGGGGGLPKYARGKEPWLGN